MRCPSTTWFWPAARGGSCWPPFWAILASLINTAKLHDLDPQTYLADVLERMISGRTPVSRLDELLAWHWKAARDALAPAAA